MTIRMSGLISNMDTDTVVEQLMSAHSLKKTKIENKITKNQWTQEKWKELNTKIYALYTGSLSKIKTQGNYKTKMVSSSDESKLTATAASTVTSGMHSVSVNQLASSQYYTGGKIEEYTDDEGNKKSVTNSTKLATIGFDAGDTITIKSGAKENGVTLEIQEDTTVDSFLAACKKAGVNASYDSVQKRIFLGSADSGQENYFELTMEGNSVEEKLGKLGLSEIEFKKDDTGEIIVDSDGNKVFDLAHKLPVDANFSKAQDSLITYNGTEIQNASNSVSINGLNLELSAVTTSPANLTVKSDTNAAYNMIKDFVKEYNTLLEEMNTLYNADSARSYDPLTDEEKEAMTDDQIEKWETKIKDSLLRKDTTLNGVLSAMKDSISGSVLNPSDGKNYSLASFGIATTGYTEKGKLHIYGDGEDATVASESDKLMKALEENPDAVIHTITTLADKLYTNLSSKMKTSSLSSALTIYNDKELSKQQTKYKEDLKKMEDKLKDMEDRYYSQFTAMEKAMASLTAQQNSLASMLGS